MRLKSLGDRDIASSLAAAMIYAGGNDPHFLCVDAICFVPSGRRKIRKRGYNPAEIIARQVSIITGIGLFYDLVKCRETRDQSELSLDLRLSNPSGAFDVTGKEAIPPRMLLIDDVLTTGATASECARVLKRSGAESVSVLVAARTLSAGTRWERDF